MRTPLLAAVLAAGLAIAGAAQAERLTDQPLVDAAWLKSHLGNESLVVLDVRDAANDGNPYDKGHVPGAISAPYSTTGWRANVNGVPGMLPPVEQIEKVIGSLGVSNDSHVVIVPNGTNSSEFGIATRIYWTFKVLGHDAVSILNGGERAWVAAGGEVSTDAVKPVAASFTGTLRSELLATAADVEKARADGTRLIDGRPAAQYKGESKSPVARVAGTIPSAVNIENAKLYDAENASFVSKETVASLAKGVDVDADKENIAFCNTGHWASVIWFGLSEVQGNKRTKMYDGSMAEWTADPARPVEPGS
ncbi:sulfurtransferase [Oceanibacterium hippocampi]|uniref:Putative thiosulfate sulfurtransferase n=1 Tax=Oceanibacterium hippocampi TaxID=745714 RepID=A0A1Y5TV39_9PROT|nr:sulfurtransferase [Oceanibacterium hippocampi]SLN73914.1 Putative thiosulfate sulfurtransferase [Oceanibacterium hippocampi]